MKRSLDIAVAGCGPGGLAAALMLHRQGNKVTLFERFADPRPIGSGLILQPPGLAVLGKLGLAAAITEAGSRIERLFGRAAGTRRVVLDVRYAALRGEVSGLGIHRGTLFHLLFEAVMREGIAIETGREIDGSERASSGRRWLRFTRGAAAGPFDFLIDALGAYSPLTPLATAALPYGALWTSLDWCGSFDPHALEQRYRRASQMVGVLPIGRMPGSPTPKAAFFWSLRGDAYARWHEASLESWKDEVRLLWPETEPLLQQIRDQEQLTFARYCHRTLRHPVEPGLAHVGDAWHSTSPQLGQGANMALLDAAALACSLATHEELPDALSAYAATRSRHVRLYQALSRLFTPFYQSDSRLLPLLRDYFVSTLSRVPPAPRVLAALVAGSVGAPLREVGLEHPDALPFSCGGIKAPQP